MPLAKACLGSEMNGAQRAGLHWCAWKKCLHQGWSFPLILRKWESGMNLLASPFYFGPPVPFLVFLQQCSDSTCFFSDSWKCTQPTFKYTWWLKILCLWYCVWIVEGSAVVNSSFDVQLGVRTASTSTSNRTTFTSKRCQKRTSGRPTADLHLANPSSCFVDPVLCVILLLVLACGGFCELSIKTNGSWFVDFWQIQNWRSITRKSEICPHLLWGVRFREIFLLLY